MKKQQLRPEQYRLILDSLSEGVCTVDRDWNIINYNRAAQELTGYREADALNLTFGDIFRCEVRECQLLLAGVMESGEAIHGVSTKFADRNGQRVPVSLNAVPLRNDQGDIAGVVATFRDNRPLENLRKELLKEFTTADIVSKNPKMRQLLDIVPDIAESGSTVLILGPTGTGKELLARAIHNASPRRGKPFIAVSCSALPDTLLESELFGYKRGAFSEAKHDKPGRFALAEGGTLFLDEIGDVPMPMQVKLLRVLQEKVYEPLGDIRTMPANVRILAATNCNLEEQIRDGTFRPDLYYRLNVIRLELPPLSERPEDIPLLVSHFLGRLSLEKGRGEKQISSEAMEILLQYGYPGNIRELENLIERAYVLSRGCVITPECLPDGLIREPWQPRTLTAPAASGTVQGSKQGCNMARARNGRSDLAAESALAFRLLSLRNLPEKEQKERIMQALRRSDGNRRKAAEELGIDPTTLWRKMRKFYL